MSTKVIARGVGLVTFDCQNIVGAFEYDPNLFVGLELYFASDGTPMLEFCVAGSQDLALRLRKLSIPLDHCAEIRICHGKLYDERVEDFHKVVKYYWCETLGVKMPSDARKYHFVDLRVSEVSKDVIWKGSAKAELGTHAQEIVDGFEENQRDLNCLILFKDKGITLDRIRSFVAACDAIQRQKDLDIAQEGQREEDAKDRWAQMAGQACSPVDSPVNQATTGIFDLPAELRNRIYRDALVEEKAIVVEINHPMPIEPGLLRSCRQIHSEAINIYFQENIFMFEIFNLNAKRLAKWFSASPFRMRSKRQLKLTGRPDFQHSLIWLERYYKQGCQMFLRPWPSERFENYKLRAVVALFDMIDELRKSGMDWNGMKKILQCSGQALKTMDASWI